MVKINKKKFNQYESVRKSGRTNMFDVGRVIELSDDLTRDEVIDIMENYEKHEKEYGEKND